MYILLFVGYPLILTHQRTAESVLSHAILDLTWAESTLWSGNEINHTTAKVWLMNIN